MGHLGVDVRLVRSEGAGNVEGRLGTGFVWDWGGAETIWWVADAQVTSNHAAFLREGPLNGNCSYSLPCQG